MSQKGKCWQLEEVKPPDWEKPESPAGWEQPQKHTENLSSLWAELGPDSQMVSLDLDDFTISNAYSLGHHSYAETMGHVVVLSLMLENEQIYTNRNFFTPHPDRVHQWVISSASELRGSCYFMPRWARRNSLILRFRMVTHTIPGVQIDQAVFLN